MWGDDGPAQKFTIIQADGLYDDDHHEQEIFSAPRGCQRYEVNYVQCSLWPDGASEGKPWSSIPKSLRDEVDGIMVLKLGFTAADLDLFPRLKVVVRMGVGYDKVDRDALAKRNVKLCNVPDYGTADIADHAIALALSLRRGIIMYNDSQRSIPAPPWAPVESPLIARLNHATFGILGLGAIGMAVAQRAKAFGCKVLFYDPFAPAGIDRSLQIERTKEISELFERSNLLSIHCPLNAQTRNLVGRHLLGLMPNGAVLVNTARGEIVDLDAVEDSLKNGSLAGVGLDVLPQEPIPEDAVHPLLRAYRNREEWLAGRMVVTPHAAWHCPESVFDVRIKSSETMRDVLLYGLDTNVIAARK